ncbi:hypothetical protein TNCV_1792791, partial [Trichonephila clavipes]
CCQTPLGGRIDHHYSECIRQSVLSRIDYGCVAYGSACNSTLQKLDPVQLYGTENLLGCVSHITGAESLCLLSSASSRSSTEEAVSYVFILRSCPCLHILTAECVCSVLQHEETFYMHGRLTSGRLWIG